MKAATHAAAIAASAEPEASRAMSATKATVSTAPYAGRKTHTSFRLTGQPNQSHSACASCAVTMSAG